MEFHQKKRSAEYTTRVQIYDQDTAAAAVADAGANSVTPRPIPSVNGTCPHPQPAKHQQQKRTKSVVTIDVFPGVKNCQKCSDGWGAAPDTPGRGY